MDKHELVTGKVLEKMVSAFGARHGSGDGCWLWTGATQGNYGVMLAPSPAPRNVFIFAHRFSWFLANGRWPHKGKIVCHTRSCTSKLCVRPEHLYEGTHKTNAADREFVKYGIEP